MILWDDNVTGALKEARHSAAGNFYYYYLTDAVGIFEGAIKHLKNRDISRFRTTDAINMAHKIKGNAAMYGHSQLGLKAADTETLLRKLTPETDSANALLSLILLIENIQNICQSHGKLEPIGLPHAPTAKDKDPSASQSADVPLGRRCILVAYRDVWISELIASLLGAEFSVVTCQTGEEVISNIRKQKPELLILEEGFGGVRDLDFVKAISNNRHAENVSIFMTFEPNSPELIAKALSLGVDGFSADKHEILDIVLSAKSILEKPAQKVLVVDDDPVVRDLLNQILTSAGLLVDTVCDGLEALTYLSQETPDIVLLDRFMPRLEGGTVLYEIQSKINLKSIPVLILTAMVNQGEATSWFERGAADFIAKPFDPEEVLMRVKQHLERTQKVGQKQWS